MESLPRAEADGELKWSMEYATAGAKESSSVSLKWHQPLIKKRGLWSIAHGGPATLPSSPCQSQPRTAYKCMYLNNVNTELFT